MKSKKKPPLPPAPAAQLGRPVDRRFVGPDLGAQLNTQLRAPWEENKLGFSPGFHLKTDQRMQPR